MEAKAVALFRAYQDYLTSTLQTEIGALDRALQAGRVAMQRLASFRLADFAACRECLPAGLLDAITEVVSIIVAAAPGPAQPMASGDVEALGRVEELAEHLMLLDLGRNDVGRVAKIGTVRPTEKIIIERYGHVMHIVSNVVGGIAAGQDARGLVRRAYSARGRPATPRRRRGGGGGPSRAPWPPPPRCRPDTRGG